MSLIWYGLVNGLREIWAHKVRTFLSVIGIVLGVTALVSMVGILEGMIGSARASFNEFGGMELISISPESVPDRQRDTAYLSPGLTMNDVRAIRGQVPNVSFITGVSPEGWEELRKRGRRHNDRVAGVEPDYKVIFKYGMEDGRFISDTDIEERARVIVLGPYASEFLFRGESPVGEEVIFEGESYTVIGVIREDFIANPGVDRNQLYWKFRQSFIPLTTSLERRDEGIDLQSIEVQIDDPRNMLATRDALANVLRVMHKGIEDFRVQTKEGELQRLEEIERNFKFTLGGIAAITLIVGGIGIMNVMLASVNERIREIGVRKAIGAQGGDVFVQFISESLLISLLGCICGMLLSLGVIRLFQELVPGGELIQSVPWNAMFIGFSFSSGVGLLSGLYPAIRAALLNPIEALRHE